MVYLPHFPTPNKTSISGDSPTKLSRILAKLNNPQNNLPPTIHIAGTNGKGSTAAFLSSIFRESGYKTHIYTSPHLHHCNERIIIANNQIDDGYLYEILEEIRITTEKINNEIFKSKIDQEISLTLFEGLTLAAILAFSKNKADVCIIETGIGGRVDATNIINNKIATILTSISFDHQEFLGNNLFTIACEKSHIMRPQIPCIIANQNLEIIKAIEARSFEISSPLVYFDKDFLVEVNEDKTFNFKYPSQNISFFQLSKPELSGWHQYINASLAIATICAIKKFQTANFDINQTLINAGLRKAKWPSRLEKLNHKLLKQDDELWIDGAHNLGGFEALSSWVKEKIFDDKNNQKPKRNYLIVGFTKNKAKAEFFFPFEDIIDFICAIRVVGDPNAEDAKQIVDKILSSQIKEVIAMDDLLDALNFLTNLDKENPCRIVICGSLYLARDFKNSRF